MKYQVTSHSAQGGRKRNEDRVAYAEREAAVLLAVADGLGGHRGGAIAAQILIDIALQSFRGVKHPRIAKPSAFLALVLMRAHQAMLAVGRAQQPPIQPRTTAVLCLVQHGYAYWAHVGDSRLYHFRGGKVLSRTLDDTRVEQLRADGVLGENEMQAHPDKSRLLKCLGASSQRPAISFGAETPLYRGDALLLCTDGLWENLGADEIAPCLTRASLEDGVLELIEKADEQAGGGGDNTSAVALRWEDGVTSTPPLQRQPLSDADQELLWMQAARTSGVVARTGSEDLATSMKSTIDELESFLRSRERK